MARGSTALKTGTITVDVGHDAIELLKQKKICQLKQNYANQKKVTSQNTITHVQFVTGVMLIAAKHARLAMISIGYQ